ncbi:MAG: hypothetical protein LBH32_15090, partial [Dysgonamonadaceae bacterium]|nr:hypothetical protein [Dysgonamonadaceae bacterium]
MKKVRKMCVNSMLTSVLALSALWLSSCSHDEFPVDKPAVPGTKGTLTFVLPLGGNKGVTYASPTTADVLQGLDDEFKIEDLWIYWFRDSDDKLQGFFSLDGGTIQMGASTTASSPTTTATITVGDNDSPSKFYIVANVNGTSPVKADGLVVGNIPGQLMVNETTSAQFEARLANLLADSNGEILEADNLTTPLPMSISSKTSSGGYVQVSDPSSAGTISDIHLKRRVARFDILNNSDYSNFVITSVYVSKAQRTGWMHDIDGVASTTWAADSLGKFVILDKANGGTLNLNGTPSIKVDTIDWSSGSPVDGQQDKIFDDFQLPDNETDYKDSLERAKAVFYLYPTEVAADGSKTEIMIEGELYGIKKIYSLDLKDLQGKVDIVANKLYTIKVKRSVSNQVKFELIVDEWDDGVEIPAGGSTSGITEWGSATADTGETFDLSVTAPNSYTYGSASEVTLTIVNKGTALNGNGHVSSISFSPVGVVDQDYLQSDYNSTATGANVTSET